MASGCVLKYEGKRGITWSLKFADASGKQVRELLGPAPEWTKRKAQAALNARLTDVRREGYRKPEPETFKSFVAGWVDDHCDSNGLKMSTRQGYRLILDGHLLPVFGSVRLAEIAVARIEDYKASKRRAGLAPRTINRHLNLLSLIFDSAQRTEKMRSNPVALVERPKEPRKRKGWMILKPAEIGRVERGFCELIDEAKDDEERSWREQARVIFLLLVDSGVRRGEILGLRWKTVALADPGGPRIRIEETFTRQRIETPKSESSERTIELSQLVADELFEHRARSAFVGDDERVFCSPTKGTPFDPTRYTATFKLALAKAEIEGSVRPFHDMRHSSITNGAAAGMAPAALQKRAGHSAFSTTQIYIDLAGVEFPEENAKLAQRLWGTVGTKSRYHVDDEPGSSDAADARQST